MKVSGQMSIANSIQEHKRVSRLEVKREDLWPGQFVWIEFVGLLCKSGRN